MVTITEALRELKTLDKRINKNINGNYIKLKQNGKVLNSSVGVTEMEKQIKSSYQSVIDLIDRRQKIKNNIVQSNAITKITVNGKSMTVADAIEYKSSIIYKKKLLQELSHQLDKALYEVNERKVDIEEKAQRMVETMVGTEDAKNISANKYEEMVGAFIKKNEYEFIDPLGIQNIIEKMGDEIEEFEANIDVVLSVSNAKTEIDI